VNRLTYIGLSIAAILVIAAVFAPFIATHDVTSIDLMNKFASPSPTHWFGTDSLGRDVFSRLVFGARISLEVGIIVTSVSLIIGMFIGSIAGYFGGWVDKILSGYIFNVFLAFPGLLLAIAMVAFLGVGLEKLILALCIIGWVGYAVSCVGKF
jgi:peptide/nickel transport system permease protein